MPLLDHFLPPLSRTHLWRSFHGAWAAATARLLNQGILPASYYAVPLVDFDGPVEIDMATLTPPAPALAVAIELPAVEDVEVQVFFDDGEPRLTATIELVSPVPRICPRPAGRSRSSVSTTCNRASAWWSWTR